MSIYKLYIICFSSYFISPAVHLSIHFSSSVCLAHPSFFNNLLPLLFYIPVVSFQPEVASMSFPTFISVTALFAQRCGPFMAVINLGHLFHLLSLCQAFTPTSWTLQAPELNGPWSPQLVLIKKGSSGTTSYYNFFFF